MSRALTKSELIDRVFAEHGSLTNREADEAVNTILNTIISALGHGCRVEIRSFGSFSLNRRRARNGRNPRTGESVAVAAKYVPNFKAGVELKTAVNEAYLAEQEKSAE